MYKKIPLFIIKFISLIPLIKYALKPFYTYGIKVLSLYGTEQKDILDIVITSNTKSKDFQYGQSDYNLLIIIKNKSKPKKTLKNIRKKIRSNLITNLVFHTQYIPIISLDESKSEALKSFLMRADINKTNYWRSILSNNEFTLELIQQNQYSNLHSAFQKLNTYLFRNRLHHSTRSKIKYIYRSLWTLGNYFPHQVNLRPSYIKRSLFLINHSFVSKIFFSAFLKDSWGALQFEQEFLKQEPVPSNKIPQQLKKHLDQLLDFEFINDITLTPTIIQKSEEKMRGKVFIDIHVGKLVLKSKYLGQLKNLEDGIKSLETPGLKIRVRTIPQALYKLQLENGFYTFPLETHYRNLETISLKGYIHNYHIDKTSFHRCATHFLISQFMRFRSYEQSSSLIGSKFIKSLNLMFRYYQVNYYLETGTFLHLKSQTQIRELLTPQFSEIKANDLVTYEEWKLIKAQLLYLLKKMRNELLKSDPSLKDLTI